jgi:hypothetical protein
LSEVTIDDKKMTNCKILLKIFIGDELVRSLNVMGLTSGRKVGIAFKMVQK